MGDVIVQLNLVQMNLVHIEAITRVVRDPNSNFVETNASRPAVAARTTGPHRYTIVAPYDDDATFSVGQACPTRIKDTGITGRTKSHVHWHTTADPNKTMVALGGMTNEGWAGFQAANNLGANAGFMVVTENHSWMEAANQQYLLSRTHDVTVRTAGAGRRAVIQADLGEVDIVAKKNIYASSPGISIMAPGDITPNVAVNYATDWTGDVPKATAGAMAKSAMTIVGTLAMAHDLGLKALKTYKTYKDGKLKAEEKIFVDSVKWAGDFAKFVGLNMPKVISVFSSPEPGAGTVKVGADSDIKMLAGSQASLFGMIGTSVGSALWTTVSAGLSASFKGRLFAGLGGTFSSIKGYRKVEVASDYGAVVVTAKTDVGLSAQNGGASIGGKSHAQVSSETSVWVNAGTNVNIGAGGGSGMGLLLDKDHVCLGAVRSANEAKNMAPDDPESLQAERNKHFRIRWASSELEMKANKTTLKSGDVNFEATSGDVTVSGSKIMLE